MEEEALEEKTLTKKERRELAKEHNKEERSRHEITTKIKKFTIWILILGFVGGGGYWLYSQTTKPLPGEEVPDLGREHITDISNFSYNSNPPTSGSHFAVWAKRGVYDRVISDGYLIHSLEHGYIVISYNCASKLSTLNYQLSIPAAFAHETKEPHEEPPSTESAESVKPLTRMKVKSSGAMSWFVPESPPEDEIGLPNEFSSDECRKLVEDIKDLLKEAKRVIIVPRIDLDTKIALTAWGRIEKIDNVDIEKIKTFIKAFHNRGPEQTSE